MKRISKKLNDSPECRFLVILLAPLSHFSTSHYGRFSTYDRARRFARNWVDNSMGGTYILLSLDHVVVKDPEVID